MQPSVHLLLNSGEDDDDDDDDDNDNKITRVMMTMIRGRVVRELSADQLGCVPRLHTEVHRKVHT